MIHVFPVRVYYEDTDMAGIVYYANYLKYIERGRTEWLRAQGVDQSVMKAETGYVFAVRRVEADYLRPARMDDLLEVRTTLIALGRARIDLSQNITRAGEVLFEGRVTIVCIGPNGRASRIPEKVHTGISAA